MNQTEIDELRRLASVSREPRHGIGCIASDCALASAARNALPRLLAALEEARDERDKLTARCRVFAADFLGASGDRDAAESLAWDALGRPEGTHDTTNVQRLCEAHGALKAELAEARAERLGYRTEYLELLRRIREGQLVTATEASLRYEGIIAASSEEPL